MAPGKRQRASVSELAEGVATAESKTLDSEKALYRSVNIRHSSGFPESFSLLSTLTSCAGEKLSTEGEDSRDFAR